MAEALSLVASIIAVLQIADSVAKTVSGLKVLYNAPNEVLALNNEVADLRVIFQTLSDRLSADDPLGTDSGSDQSAEHLHILIRKAEDHLLQLDEVIRCDSLRYRSVGGNLSVSRFKWAKVKSRVERHIQALRDVKQNIMVIMLALNSHVHHGLCVGKRKH